MSKQVKSRSDTLKMFVAVLFLVGMILCYWAQQSVLAFIILIVGVLLGNAAREAKYQEQAEKSQMLDALRESVVVDKRVPPYDVRFRPVHPVNTTDCADEGNKNKGQRRNYYP